MKATKKRYSLHLLLTIGLAVTALAACSLGGKPPATQTGPTATPANGSGGDSANQNTAHVITPAALIPGAISVANDQNTQPSASLRYVASGDAFDLNRFERPFTQTTMDYLPALDIQSLRISKDATWFYGSLQLAGVDQKTNTLNGGYSLEIDLNKDGRGDILIWVTPPYTTDWSTAGVKVYTDPDGDVGGPRPLKSDAPTNGDGYEKVIFNAGQGADPDLAWVRISPDSASTIQFAFKQTLLNGNTAFMIGGWADAAVMDPAKFNYNDHFTPSQAGSPIHADPNYPVKALFAMDNTCRAAVGFIPTGTEPLVCPLPPTPTPTVIPGKVLPTLTPTQRPPT